MILVKCTWFLSLVKKQQKFMKKFQEDNGPFISIKTLALTTSQCNALFYYSYNTNAVVRGLPTDNI